MICCSWDISPSKNNKNSWTIIWIISKVRRIASMLQWQKFLLKIHVSASWSGSHENLITFVSHTSHSSQLIRPNSSTTVRCLADRHTHRQSDNITIASLGGGEQQFIETLPDWTSLTTNLCEFILAWNDDMNWSATVQCNRSYTHCTYISLLCLSVTDTTPVWLADYCSLLLRDLSEEVTWRVSDMQSFNISALSRRFSLKFSSSFRDVFSRKVTVGGRRVIIGKSAWLVKHALMTAVMYWHQRFDP